MERNVARDRVPPRLHKFRKDQRERQTPEDTENKTKNQGREMQRKQIKKYRGSQDRETQKRDSSD